MSHNVTETVNEESLSFLISTVKTYQKELSETVTNLYCHLTKMPLLHFFVIKENCYNTYMFSLEEIKKTLSSIFCETLNKLVTKELI